jgi:hypothetical protein
MSDSNEVFELQFSNRVIEHLGIKLYQNRPTNVIAEFVSNAWDADATEVNINIVSASTSNTSIYITDNGCGMNGQELKEKFLIIGRNRRPNSPTEKTSGGRGITGRKGIGKLAGFGIAKTVDILTISKTDGNRGIYWLRFSLDELIKADTAHQNRYLPQLLANGKQYSLVKDDPEYKKISGQIDTFLSTASTPDEGGTAVILSDITLKKQISSTQLIQSLGRRFTTTIKNSSFCVRINGKEIEASEALPPFFDFKIGSIEEPIIDKIVIQGTEREIKYWVRFVSIGDTDWSIENAGIGIYSHGKIAQDRPFFFDIRGKEIYSRYLYGVVEVDWLDELGEDVVSTDRRSINWESEDTDKLHKWGVHNIMNWLNLFQKWRQEKSKVDTKKIIRSTDKKWDFSAPEEEALIDLLGQIIPDLGNNSAAISRTVNSFGDAWIHEPTRKLTQSLWESVYKDSQNSSEDFINLLERIRESMIPEAMGLAMTMAQKISAITALMRMIDTNQRETDLQRLIEKFPWLLGHEWELLTANQEIRTLVREQQSPNIAAGEWELDEIRNPGLSLKPDFVFLSDNHQKEIIVFEIKGPECDKTLLPCEYDQLQNYIRIIRRARPHTAKVKGILVGHDKGGFEKSDSSITVYTWAEVLQDARMKHLIYLHSLLQASKIDSKDSRLAEISEFGGKETMELLKKLDMISPLDPIVKQALPTM